MPKTATASSYSITMRLHTPPDHGIVGIAATAITGAGGVVTAIDVVESSPSRLRLDVTCSAADASHATELQDRVATLEGVEVHKVSDRRAQPELHHPSGISSGRSGSGGVRGSRRVQSRFHGASSRDVNIWTES